MQVWVARVPRDGSVAALEAELSAEERERAARLYFEQDRRRFVAAHGFLRRLLADELGCAPRDVPIATGAGGKPELVPAQRLRFNLAYSHELVACAVALDREVGVDIERIRSARELGAAVRGVLSEREREAFRTLAAEQADEAFFAAWTRKEAVLKARGEGLARPASEIEVELHPARPARLLSVEGEPGAEQRWSVHTVDVGPGYAAAVAAERDLAGLSA